MWERAGSGRRSDEGAVPADIDAECQTAFASRLAPTLVQRCWCQISDTKKPCPDCSGARFFL